MAEVRRLAGIGSTVFGPTRSTSRLPVDSATPGAGTSDTAADRLTDAPRQRGTSGVPPSLTLAAAWSWRLLVVGALGYFVLRFLVGLTLLVVPVFLSLLLAALMHRPVLLLRRFLSRGLAAFSVMLAALAVMGAVGWLVTVLVAGQYADLVIETGNVLAQLRRWTSSLGWLGSGSATLVDRLISWVQSHDSVVLTSALTAGRVATETLTGLVLTGFITLFLLIDGDRMWSWLVRLLPRAAQPPANGAGHRGFGALSGWVTGTSIIALIHGLVIGLALWLVGAPLVFPLAVLVFIGSFVPIIGAFVFGGLATLITLVAVGPVPAAIVLAVLVVEDLLEGHVYQPLIMGRAVRLHPVVVLVALTAGSVLGGIMGALIAIPLAAAVHAAVKYLTGIEDINGNPLREEDRMQPCAPPRSVASSRLRVGQAAGSDEFGPSPAGKASP